MTQTILLDDDPTGTQTVSGVAVLTEWSVSALARELERRNAGFFVLTNSRALPTESAYTLYEAIGGNLKAASAQTQIPVRVLARGDSTLRGHFPATSPPRPMPWMPFWGRMISHLSSLILKRASGGHEATLTMWATLPPPRHRLPKMLSLAFAARTCASGSRKKQRAA